MIFTLKKDQKKRVDAEIGKEMILEMVKAYHDPNTDKKKDFKFAHFPVTEILKLFVDNKIIKETELINPNIVHGMKIYIGNHHKLDNCPQDAERPSGRNEDYLTYNTPILCNTVFRGKDFADMLDEKQNDKIILINGYGVDQSVLCPPDCPEEVCSTEPSTKDEQCIYDITKKPKD